MGIEYLSGRSLLTLYENIRQLVFADARLGSRYRLMGETAKQQAEQLFKELNVAICPSIRPWLHESGTYVKITEAGAAVFA